MRSNSDILITLFIIFVLTVGLTSCATPPEPPVKVIKLLPYNQDRINQMIDSIGDQKKEIDLLFDKNSPRALYEIQRIFDGFHNKVVNKLYDFHLRYFRCDQLTGTVNLKITVTNSGQVSVVGIKQSNIYNRNLHNNLLTLVQLFYFGEKSPTDNDFTFLYPFTFSCP